MVLRKEEENNKGMTAAERSQFGFCGTISAEFCNAARKVCNLAGAKRTEMGTVRAVRAVYARAYYGHVYRTHKDAVDAHKASLRNFMYWKRKLGWMAAKYGYPELIFEGKQMVDSGPPAGKVKSSDIPRPVAVRAEPVKGMDATVKPPSGKTPLQADPTQMAKARLLLGFSGGELNDDKTRKYGFGHEVMSRFRPHCHGVDVRLPGRVRWLGLEGRVRDGHSAGCGAIEDTAAQRGWLAQGWLRPRGDEPLGGRDCCDAGEQW